MGIIISEGQLLLNFGLLKQDFKVNFLLRKKCRFNERKGRKRREGEREGEGGW